VAVHAAWSIRAVDVITVLEAAIARYGAPEHLRSDNGPELIAYAIQDWVEKASIKTIYITPGSPWENGHIESFHDKLRDECLNRDFFGSLLEARVILEAWRIEYNESRPHSSLGYQTPGSSRGAATLGSLRPELPSTPKPTTNNNQQNFRSELSHLRGQAIARHRSFATPRETNRPGRRSRFRGHDG
jgi:hypothetical protein